MAIPPRRLVHRTAREGFPYKEKDALGQRVARRGELLVYLFVCWPELLEQAKGWLGTAATVGALWFFFLSPLYLPSISAISPYLSPLNLPYRWARCGSSSATRWRPPSSSWATATSDKADRLCLWLQLPCHIPQEPRGAWGSAWGRAWAWEGI